jgi:hypothetical protein
VLFDIAQCPVVVTVGMGGGGGGWGQRADHAIIINLC